MLLFRILIAIVLIALFIPLGREPAGQQGSEISPLSAIAAAGAAVSDMRGFCDRQPQACDVGARALQAMGERARAGAHALQEFVAEQQGAATTPAVETVAPNSGNDRPTLTDMLNRLARANGAEPPPGPDGAHDTLLPEDREPAWQKPNLRPGRG